MPAFSRTPAREVTPKIRDLALRALKLDSSLAEPHIDLAYASYLDYDWAGAEAEFHKGLALGPGDAGAHRWYAAYLADVGRLTEALKESETAERLDPVSPYVLAFKGRILYLMRRYDEAIEQSKKTVMLEAEFGHAHRLLGDAYLQKHMYAEAIAEFTAARRQIRNSPIPTAELAYAYAVSGNVSESRKILRELLEESKLGPFPPKAIADVYIALCDKDSAFEWLRKAIDGHDVYLCLTVDPIYDTLRSEPRFAQLLQLAGLTGL